MFLSSAKLKRLKEKGNINALCKAAIKHRNETIWIQAVDYLLERSSEVDWAQLFSKLTLEKQNYCINMLIHRLAIPEYKEDSLYIIKEIGESAVAAVINMFYQHVYTIKTTKDFEKLQGWLEELLNIIVYCKPLGTTELFIKIYKETTNQDVRYMILEHMGKLGEGQAVDFIKKRIYDELIFTRIAAIRALGLTGNPEIVSIILDQLYENSDNSSYIKVCLEALINIGDKRSVEILVLYLHKDIGYILKEKIVKALLRSPYVETKDIESWFKSDISYELQEILIRAIVEGEHAERISEYIIKYVTKLCFDCYGKGNDLYIWCIRLLQIRENEALQYLVSLFLDEDYKNSEVLCILIAEFGRNAFPYLKGIYPLVEAYEAKTNILRLMASVENDRLARFLFKNIDDVHSLFSFHIADKNEGELLELIAAIGEALKDYHFAKEALKPIAVLLLSKCRESNYSDEEKFNIKILYHFYKYFYFEEVEEFFIDYLDGDYPLWRYAVRALECHETDSAKRVLERYAAKAN